MSILGNRETFPEPDDGVESSPSWSGLAWPIFLGVVTSLIANRMFNPTPRFTVQVVDSEGESV